MKCELCGASQVYQCVVCKMWLCQCCISWAGMHPHREKEKNELPNL